MTLTRSEAGRKVVHIAAGAFGLLLRWMTWPEAAALALGAFLFNWQILPRVGGRALWREGEHGRGYPPGILLYPLAVLALVLAFRQDLWMAAAVSGVLAAGDGMASLAGQGLGGPRLPWNREKTWIGFAAFVSFGAAAALGLAAWTAWAPSSARVDPPWLPGVCLLLALACAIVESLPTRIDDNITVPFAGGLVMAALAHARAGAVPPDVDLPARVLGGVAVNLVLSALAWRARALDAAGALSTVLLGTAITAGLGLPGLAVMVTFFVAGTASTWLGYGRKRERGIAQERGGARGWRSAWANGAVPATLALLALLAAREDRLMWVVAYAASVATAAADTCSSEIGKAYGRRTVLVTTFEPVSPGVEGGVSLAGTMAGVCAAALVGAVGVWAGLYGWPAAVLVGLAGLAGSLAESVLGRLAIPRGGIGDHTLNAINTALGAALAAVLVLAAR
jgi:uncharacterized protein (TIGR00297 family)